MSGKRHGASCSIGDPPDCSQAGTIRIIDGVLRMLTASRERPRLGGSVPCLPAPGEPREVVDSAARLIVPLKGIDRHAISVRGERADVEVCPGQIIYFAPNAWSIPFMDTVCDFFGVVFRSPWNIRLIQVQQRATPVYQGTKAAYHTSMPIAGPAELILRAISELAEAGNNGPPAKDLLISLLQMVRQQVADNVPNQPHQRAAHTWKAVEAYLDEHYDQTVTRDSVAAAFGLNRTYLSTLARQVSGHTFRETLEGIRMQQARRLLRTTDLKLARIAGLCGFTEVTHFAKAFRRAAGVTPGRFRAHASDSS